MLNPKNFAISNHQYCSATYIYTISVLFSNNDFTPICGEFLYFSRVNDWFFLQLTSPDNGETNGSTNHDGTLALGNLQEALARVGFRLPAWRVRDIGKIFSVSNSQRGNLRIFLSLKFCVKSIFMKVLNSEPINVLKRQFLASKGHRNWYHGKSQCGKKYQFPHFVLCNNTM